MQPSSKKSEILRAEKILFSVPGRSKKILNVNLLGIESGVCTFILGENGAGKSSLLSILGGQVSPTEGELFWKSKKLLPVSERLVPGFDGVELVQQNPVLTAFWTVENELEKAVRHLPEAKKIRKKNHLVRLCHLKPLLDQKTGNLSGGEKRRLAIALALAKETEVLLLDEPFAELDYVNKTLLTQILLELKSTKKMSIVLVSHHGEDAQWLADRIMVIHAGKIIEKLNRTNEGFSPKFVQTARLLGYKNLIRLTEFSLNSNFGTSEKGTWIEIPETAIGTQNQKEWIEWETFILVRQFKEHDFWKMIFEKNGLLIYVKQPSELMGDSAILFVGLNECRILK